ncbi:MAG: hypothetical protein OIF48_12490, partial [Silicimonas sp.]|nr:hypothetical protein [Silicimonas sp.]
MDAPNITEARRKRVWLDETAGDFNAFREAVEVETQAADWPFAAEIAGNIPLYDGVRVRREAEAPQDLLSEWNAVFDHGPGVIVIKNGMEDTAMVDAASDIFARIIEAERATGSGGGDHFAKPGANDRVWNAAE